MSSVSLPWINDHNGVENYNFDTDFYGWLAANVVGSWGISHRTSPHTFVGEQTSYYGGGFGRLSCLPLVALCSGYIWKAIKLNTAELNKPMRFSTLMYSSKSDASITMTVKIGNTQGGSQYYESTGNTGLFMSITDSFTPTNTTIYVSVHMAVSVPDSFDYIGIDYFSLDRQENALVDGRTTTWSSEALVTGTSWS